MNFLQYLRPSQAQSWWGRGIRWTICLLVPPFLVALLGVAFLIWRLGQGPLNITPFVSHWRPFVVSGSKQDKNHVALYWDYISLQWLSEKHFSLSALKIHAQGLKLSSAKGHDFDYIHDAQIIFKLRDLIKGTFSPTQGQLIGGHISLKQDPHAAITLDLGKRDNATQGKALPSNKKKIDLAFFHSLILQNFTVRLKKSGDETKKIQLQISKLNLSYESQTGWQGDAALEIQQNHKNIALSLLLKSAGSDLTQWIARSSFFTPSDYALWLPPSLQNISYVNLPIALESRGHFVRKDRMGRWSNFTVQIKLGEGSLRQDHNAPLMVSRGNFKIIGQNDLSAPLSQRVKLQIPQGHLTLRDDNHQNADFFLNGEMKSDDLFAPQNIKIALALAVPKLDFAHLASIWPVNLVEGGRRWISANMTSGLAEKFKLKVTLESRHGWNDIDATGLEGGLWGHDLTVHWLKPLPPVRHIKAHAHFLSADALQIDLKHGKLITGKGTINVPTGRILLTGLSKRDQNGDIRLNLKGELPGFLEVLSHPRLKLLSRYNVPLRNVKGLLEGDLGLTLPLDSRVLMADIGFDVKAKFDQLGFYNPVIGALEQGQGFFRVTSSELTAELQSVVRHIPLSLSVKESFAKKPPGEIDRALKVQATVKPEQLAQLGINLPPHMMSGKILAQAHYDQMQTVSKKAQSDLSLSLDLTHVNFKAPFWQKSAGAPAHITGHAQWLDGMLTSIDHLNGNGPALKIKGQAVLNNGDITGLTVTPLLIGRNKGSLTLGWPINNQKKKDYKVFFKGDVLDISPWLAKKPATNSKKKDEIPQKALLNPISLPTGNWAVAVTAKKIFYDQDQFFSNFLAGAHWAEQSLREAHISLARPYKLGVVLEDSSTDPLKKRFTFSSSNVGGLLSKLNLTKQLEGGKFQLNGYFKNQQEENAFGLGLGPFYGKMQLRNIAILNPPAILKLATFFSPTKWGQLGRNRFENVDASATLRVDDKRLIFHNGQLGNNALGGWFRGVMNLKTQILKMKGTISPFFSFKEPSRKLHKEEAITKLKKKLSLTALTYKIDGTLANPHIDVNPFSIYSPAP
ncbi:YhdP family protein [Aristophania vespae]|uniref:YhdP family protein n=1 Tax=Aristophania vespae TaxID=2697033 RepID=UPI002351A351|nr:DUF3971 domain-containing protein [Aristophania vespae]UMM64470.1 hypothetical protein DM15PD_14840 [Aristophania vespae]